jgi:hypothetical protein
LNIKTLSQVSNSENYSASQESDECTA